MIRAFIAALTSALISIIPTIASAAAVEFTFETTLDLTYFGGTPNTDVVFSMQFDTSLPESPTRYRQFSSNTPADFDYGTGSFQSDAQALFFYSDIPRYNQFLITSFHADPAANFTGDLFGADPSLLELRLEYYDNLHPDGALPQSSFVENGAFGGYIFIQTTNGRQTGFPVSSGILTYAVEGDPISDVPLPASLPLLLAGIGGVALIRRRRG